MKNNVIFLTFIVSTATTSYNMEQPPADKPSINPIITTHNQYEALYCPPLQQLVDTSWLSNLYKECENTKSCEDLYEWLNETIYNNENLLYPIVIQTLTMLTNERTKIKTAYDTKKVNSPKDLCAHHRKNILGAISKISKNNTTLQRPASAPSSDQKPVKKRSKKRKKPSRK